VQNIQSNLVALNARIDAACEAAGRTRESVTLIGVSKTKPASDVRTAAGLGLREFGENYLDEAIAKIDATQDLDLIWHYIGRIQSNKTKDIATHFDWVHTVDRNKIAQRLNNQCPKDKILNVLLQINIDADPAKGGVPANAAADLLATIVKLPHLRPRGLMTILSQTSDPGAGYNSMAQLFADLSQSLDADSSRSWDTLSMGMTGDLEQAIAAGATHIRIGTALFGARNT
jgi:PLP dependent protein